MSAKGQLPRFENMAATAPHLRGDREDIDTLWHEYEV